MGTCWDYRREQKRKTMGYQRRKTRNILQETDPAGSVLEAEVDRDCDLLGSSNCICPNLPIMGGLVFLPFPDYVFQGLTVKNLLILKYPLFGRQLKGNTVWD